MKAAFLYSGHLSEKSYLSRKVRDTIERRNSLKSCPGDWVVSLKSAVENDTFERALTLPLKNISRVLCAALCHASEFILSFPPAVLTPTKEKISKEKPEFVLSGTLGPPHVRGLVLHLKPTFQVCT